MGRHILVITSAVLVGAALFVGSFVAMDFEWIHFVLTDPQKVGIGDGVVVVGGGFVFGTTLGLAGLIFVLCRYWPRNPAK